MTTPVRATVRAQDSSHGIPSTSPPGGISSQPSSITSAATDTTSSNKYWEAIKEYADTFTEFLRKLILSALEGLRSGLGMIAEWFGVPSDSPDPAGTWEIPENTPLSTASTSIPSQPPIPHSILSSQSQVMPATDSVADPIPATPLSPSSHFATAQPSHPIPPSNGIPSQPPIPHSILSSQSQVMPATDSVADPIPATPLSPSSHFATAQPSHPIPPSNGIPSQPPIPHSQTAQDPFTALPITDIEKQKIFTLICAMAGSWLNLLGRIKEMKRIGVELEKVPPLRFIEYIFKHPTLPKDMESISKSDLTWKPFVNGFGEKMRREAATIPLCLPGFARSLNVNLADIGPFIRSSNWNGLLRFLIDVKLKRRVSVFAQPPSVPGTTTTTPPAATTPLTTTTVTPADVTVTTAVTTLETTTITPPTPPQVLRIADLPLESGKGDILAQQPPAVPDTTTITLSATTTPPTIITAPAADVTATTAVTTLETTTVIPPIPPQVFLIAELPFESEDDDILTTLFTQYAQNSRAWILWNTWQLNFHWKNVGTRHPLKLLARIYAKPDLMDHLQTISSYFGTKELFMRALTTQLSQQPLYAIRPYLNNFTQTHSLRLDRTRALVQSGDWKQLVEDLLQKHQSRES